KEYIFVSTTKNWTDAQAYCKQNYEDLATVTTAEENQIVYALIGSTNRAWIGMYRSQINVNIWMWSDESSSFFFSWNIYQPSNSGGNQNCVEIEPGGWNDQFCYTNRMLLCYRFLVLVKEEKTWAEALDYCRSKYNGLASPTPETQEQFADMEISQAQTKRVWTGLRFLDGKWIWVSKNLEANLDPLPSCPDLRYHCGTRNSKNQIWENRDCNEKLNFLCYK
ncbi:C-type mannose receptor 2, partial [Silurus asotus]